MANLLVILATGLAWWSLIPQIVRLVKTSDPSGVSSAWPSIGLVTNAGWTGYLASQELWAAMPSTTVMTISYALVIWALIRSGRPPGRGMIAGLAWAGLLVTIGVSAGWGAVGTTLAWSYLVQFTPAVIAAYRTARPTGIAPGTWISIMIESVLWGGYGHLNGDRPVVTYAVIGVVVGALILLRHRYAGLAASTGAAGSETTKHV